jgi:PAS domain-containing protein
MSQARTGAAAAAMKNGSVLVTGGIDAAGAASSSAEIYGSSGTFTQAAPMNIARTGHTATWLPAGASGYVLVTGGITTDGSIAGSAELYDPAANSWTLLAAPASTGAAATPLPNSSLLLSGGVNSSGLLSELQRFDLATQQFSFAGALPLARKSHAACALLDGRVLIVGGVDEFGNTLASTEIYDPIADTISPGPALNTPRANATATTLLDGKVLIAGGRYAELYGIDPARIRPGTTLREIIDQRIAMGHYAGWSADDVVREMAARVASKQVSRIVNKLADGRIVAASIQPRADGGWVVTLEDMTEREALNARLARQNKLLKQREEELEAQNTRFNAAINNMSQGLCLFNSEQRVMFANRRFAEIYKLDPEQVKSGTTLRQILEARVARGAYSNIDGAKFVADGVASFGQAVSQIIHLADGRFISVLRRPMPDGGVVSTHEDITEREKLNAKVAQQHEQLDAALENMLQGVAMFDAEQRLIVCNSRYATMYGLTPEQVRPGTTVREIFQHRLANGFYNVTDKDGFVRGWTNSFGEVSSRIQELADGRIINVTRHGMANGGRLVTHEDITERQKLTAQLEAQHRLLKEQEGQLRQQNLRLMQALQSLRSSTRTQPFARAWLTAHCTNCSPMPRLRQWLATRTSSIRPREAPCELSPGRMQSCRHPTTAPSPSSATTRRIFGSRCNVSNAAK